MGRKYISDSLINDLFIKFTISVLVIFISLLIANRDLTVGTDSLQYAFIFDSMSSKVEGRYEIGFEILIIYLKKMGFSYRYYFFVQAVLVSGILLHVSTMLTSRYYKLRIEELSLSMLVIALMLISSWYFVAVTNGLRQGLSLVFMFLAISQLVSSRYIISIVTMIISLTLHKSALLIVPFLPLLYAKSKTFAIVFALSALASVAGYNELFVSFISSLLGISLYQEVADYGQFSNWSGFQFDFFVYTLFWYYFPYALKRLGLIKQDHAAGVEKARRIYAVLAMPFLVFGFGGYVNRYGFMSWLFLPVYQAIMLNSLSTGMKYKLTISFVLAFSSLLYFAYIRVM